MINFKVLLINPRDKTVPEHSYGVTDHLGLGYLAAYLRENEIEVKIIDCDAEGISDEDVVEMALDYNPNMIGITGLIRTIGCGLSIADSIRSKNEDVFIFTGGQHASYAAEEILSNHSSINCVIRGEGEITLLEVVKRVNNSESLDGVLGLYYKDGSQIIKNQDRPAIENLDVLPFPARDTLKKIISDKRKTPVISILTSRGCSGGCSFCNSASYFNMGGGQRWRGRSPINVVDEIEYLVETFKNENTYWVMHIYDDYFIGPGESGRERARAIAEEMIKRDLRVPFDIFCRADSFKNNEDLLVLLKKAGMVSTFIGLESGMPETLKLFTKGVTPQDNIDTLNLMEKHNIATPASGFIMFNPYVTYEELRQNSKYLLDLNQATFWNLSVNLILFRGTRLVDRVKNDGLLGEKTHFWAAYNYDYVIPEIKELAQKMDFTNHPTMIQLDSVGRYIENSLCKLVDQIEELDVERDTFDKIKHSEGKVRGKLKDIQIASVDFFLKALDLSENKKIHEFDGLKEEFLATIESSITIATKEYETYVNTIDELVS